MGRREVLKLIGAAGVAGMIPQALSGPASASGGSVGDRDRPIVTESNAADPTHFLSSQGASMGFSDMGGGYGNHLDLGDGVNMIAPGYGRGIQSSLRDELHSGRYNPTQGGFQRDAGVPVTLSLQESDRGHRLRIHPFNLPLFSDAPYYDFTEHEELYRDWARDDGGNSDTDGIFEGGLSQDAELRSEFDYRGFVEDASLALSQPVPTFRHVYAYDYSRDPGPPLEEGEQPAVYSPIHQFSKNGVKANGDPVIVECGRVTDVSPGHIPGKQATDIDMGVGILSFSGRINYSLGYHNFMWLGQAGEWHSRPFGVEGDPAPGAGDKPNVDQYVKLFGDQHTEVIPCEEGLSPQQTTAPPASSGLILLSDGVDPFTASAFGIYVPQSSPVNRDQVVGLDRTTGKEIYREDRRIRTFGFGGMRGTPGSTIDMQGTRIENHFTVLVVRMYFTGMFAPRFGDPNANERVQMEAYMLLGTPDQIKTAAGEIAAVGGYADPTVPLLEAQI